jgi:hypothetical protein
MNDTRLHAHRWLAPAIAFLFLAGLVTPAASGGPLGLPTPVAPVTTFNVLALSADGSVLAWQNVGSDHTTLHIQGVQAGATGFNLADPLGRLVGEDRSSSTAGFVEFTDLSLLKGTYTLLGPTATVPAVVLARFDLSSFANSEASTFTSPMDAAGSLSSAVERLCAATPVQWTGLSLAHLALRGYASSTPACALRLGEQGCLMDLKTPCAWAVAWAVASKLCPGGPDETLEACLSRVFTQPRTIPCSEDASSLYCQVQLFVQATLQDAEATILHDASCTTSDALCVIHEYLARPCPSPDKYGSCKNTKMVLSLALALLDGGGGGGTLPSFCLTMASVSCATSCSPGAAVCGVAVMVPSRQVAELLTTPSNTQMSNGDVVEACSKMYDPSLFNPNTRYDNNQCMTPVAPQSGQSPSYGWIYCGMHTDCASTGSVHVQLWWGAPRDDVYSAPWHDYNQAYFGFMTGCPDPSSCSGGTPGASVDRADARPGPATYKYDPAFYYHGPECTVIPPDGPSDTADWICDPAGLYGSFVEIQPGG